MAKADLKIVEPEKPKAGRIAVKLAYLQASVMMPGLFASTETSIDPVKLGVKMEWGPEGLWVIKGEMSGIIPAPNVKAMVLL